MTPPGSEPLIMDPSTRGRHRGSRASTRDPSECTLCFMSTHSLRDLRNSLGSVVREVAYTGHEAIVTDNGREVAVIISMDDYERLHEHADVADALRLRDLRSAGFATVSLDDMLTELGVSIDEIAQRAG